MPTYRFDTSIFTVPCEGIVTLNGPGVFAHNIQVDNHPMYCPEHNYTYPVYFEVGGLRRHYTVSVWSDCAEIEVLDNDTLQRRCTIKPRNQSELLEALETVGADFEELHDFMMAQVMQAG